MGVIYRHFSRRQIDDTDDRPTITILSSIATEKPEQRLVLRAESPDLDEGLKSQGMLSLEYHNSIWKKTLILWAALFVRSQNLSEE